MKATVFVLSQLAHFVHEDAKARKERIISSYAFGECPSSLEVELCLYEWIDRALEASLNASGFTEESFLKVCKYILGEISGRRGFLYRAKMNELLPSGCALVISIERICSEA